MKLRRNRYQKGSVVLDPRSQTWSFRFYDNAGQRKAERIGTLKEFPTKSKAQHAAEPIRLRINAPEEATAITTLQVAERYRKERMPQRHSTSRGYEVKLKIVLEKWGNDSLPLKPYEVEAWLKELRTAEGKTYSPKTLSHVCNMLTILHDAAMFWGYLPIERNPMSVVRVAGSSKRTKQLVFLTTEEFRLLLSEIKEGPYRLMVMLAGCLGLRTSEIFGLQWGDFDWLRTEVHIQRAVVEGHVDETKTVSSNKKLPLDPSLVTAVQSWKQCTVFNMDGDWVFASPVALGKMPLNSNSAQRDFLRPASIRAGLKPIGWHALRHSYRTWLDEFGAEPMVQKELMRHSSITMTMDGYGRGVPAANREANARVVGQLLQ
jgi:integrase